MCLSFISCRFLMKTLCVIYHEITHIIQRHTHTHTSISLKVSRHGVYSGHVLKARSDVVVAILVVRAAQIGFTTEPRDVSNASPTSQGGDLFLDTHIDTYIYLKVLLLVVKLVILVFQKKKKKQQQQQQQQQQQLPTYNARTINLKERHYRNRHVPEMVGIVFTKHDAAQNGEDVYHQEK
jgi:hypothetical protein